MSAHPLTHPKLEDDKAERLVPRQLLPNTPRDSESHIQSFKIFDPWNERCLKCANTMHLERPAGRGASQRLDVLPDVFKVSFQVPEEIRVTVQRQKLNDL